MFQNFKTIFILGKVHYVFSPICSIDMSVSNKAPSMICNYYNSRGRDSNYTVSARMNDFCNSYIFPSIKIKTKSICITFSSTKILGASIFFPLLPSEPQLVLVSMFLLTLLRKCHTLFL